MAESGKQEQSLGYGGDCMRDKITVAVNACDNAAKHYDDYFKGFVALDGKAQALTTVSGLVLAAIAAFLKDGRVPVLVNGSRWWILLILAAPAAALTAVILSLVGVRVKDVVIPFDAPEQIREAKLLTGLDCREFTEEHVLDYYLGRLDHWEHALPSIASAVEKKGSWILRCQSAMTASLALLLLLFVVILVKS